MNYTFLRRTAWELKIWKWREQCIAFFIALAVFTMLGPFGTFALHLPDRLLYWSIALSVGWVAIIASMTLVLRHPDLDDWPGSARAALAVAIATAPITWGVQAIEEWLRPTRNAIPFIHFALNVTIVCGLIVAAMYFRISQRIGEMPETKKSPAPLLNRLPFELGRELVSFSMQDHYVEVTTTKGSTLILMSLGDAMEEAGCYGGVRIHRSHWIATDAYRGLVRRDGKLFAKLIDGRELPVSRTYASTVRGLEPSE